eukprot:3062083-Amphidinium_carterae.1
MRSQTARANVRLHQRADINLAFMLHPGLGNLDPASLVHAKQLMDWHWVVNTPSLTDYERWAAVGAAAAKALTSRCPWRS